MMNLFTVCGLLTTAFGLVATTHERHALGNLNGMNDISGGYTIERAKQHDSAGRTFRHPREDSEPDFLIALGPFTEDVIIPALLQEPNKGTQYEYKMPIEILGSGDYGTQFIWKLGEWSECSTGGTQKRAVVCQRAIDGSLAQHSYCDQSSMPSEQTKTCNSKPREPEWYVGEWQPCSVTCGGGERIRVVNCQRNLSQSGDEVIEFAACEGQRPISNESCNLQICPPQWVAREWSQCNSVCGIGWKKREVECMSSDATDRYHSSRCNARHKPPTNARCNAGNCPPPRWITGRWGKCSAKCGIGRQIRRVACVSHERRRSNRCPSNVRPPTVQSCRSECVTEVPSVGQACVNDPKFGHCALVKKFNFCLRSYFRKMCCQSCST